MERGAIAPPFLATLLPGPLFVNIIVNYRCARVLLYTKMPKEAKTDETRLFCHIFFIVGFSIGRGAGPPRPLLWLRLCSIVTFQNEISKSRIQNRLT